MCLQVRKGLGIPVLALLPSVRHLGVNNRWWLTSWDLSACESAVHLQCAPFPSHPHNSKSFQNIYLFKHKLHSRAAQHCPEMHTLLLLSISAKDLQISWQPPYLQNHQGPFLPTWQLGVLAYISINGSSSVTEQTNRKTRPMILIFQSSTFPISHGFLPFLAEHLLNSLWSWRVKCEKRCWKHRFNTPQRSTTPICFAEQVPRCQWWGPGGWIQKATPLLKEQAHIWSGILFLSVWYKDS